MRIIYVLLIILINSTTFSLEKLIVVQNVSTSGKTFVIAKGHAQGISSGQESIFSNDTASFKAYAKEVNKDDSLWQIKRLKGQVPFRKNDIILFSDAIDFSLQSSFDAASRSNVTYLDPRYSFKSNSSFYLKTHLIQSFSETVSETNSSQLEGRKGLQFDLRWGYFFNPKWELGFALRYDKEVSTIKNPELDVPTSRYMLLFDISYFFNEESKLHARYYSSIGFGAGLSQTTVNKISSKGFAYVLPFVKAGMLSPISDKYKLLFEFGFESIVSKESFSNSNEQTTNLVNGKFAVGLKF